MLRKINTGKDGNSMRKLKNAVVFLLVAAFVAGIFNPANPAANGFSAKAEDAETITVYVSIFGDTKHGEGEVHSLTETADKLLKWADHAAVTLDKDKVAKDALDIVLAEKGISAEFNEWGIVSINGLAGGDNGLNSSWLYKINGKDAPEMISTQALNDNDNIIFYFTDDWSVDFGTDYSDDTDSSLIKPVSDEELKKIYNETVSCYEENAATSSFTTSDWIILAMAKSGAKVPSDYYKKQIERLTDIVREKEGVLSKTSATEYDRVIIALTAAGADVKNAGGYNLLQALSDYDFVTKQGINGAIYTLIAFDCGKYEIPEAATRSVQTTRELLINYILEQQLEDGGFAYFGNVSDPDLTAMALISLAPYKADKKVEAAIKKAVDCLSAIQDKEGTYSSFGTACVESAAQVIIALSTLGINPKSDSRFIKNGKSLMDAFCAFYLGEGRFAHNIGDNANVMASEQAYMALAAYYRFVEGKTPLYDILAAENDESDNSQATPSVTPAPDDDKETTPPPTGDNVMILYVLVMISSLGILYTGKKKSR